MGEQWQPTGVHDAVLIDVLRELGHDAGTVTQMTAQDRLDAVVQADTEGRLAPDVAQRLRRAGILPEADR